MPVVPATATQGDIDITLNALGTVTPLATVTVKTQIAGQIVRSLSRKARWSRRAICWREIDPRPYRLALAAGAGRSSTRDQALLQARNSISKRYQNLAEQNSIAQPAGRRPGLAGAAVRGHGEVRPGADRQRQAQLAYCHIVAPVDGRVGLRQVDPGNYVTPAATATGLVVITQMQPITRDLHRARGQSAGDREAACTPAPSCRSRPIDRSGTTKLARRRACRRSTTRSTPRPAR